MTVLSKSLYWTGSTGTRSGTSSNEKSEYTAVWLVKTNDALDQADTINNYFRTTGPYLGATYSYGNDSNPKSVLQKITPNRARESAFVWYVTLSYAPPENSPEESKPDESGNQTTDPLSWADEMNISHSTIRVPVYKAKHRGGLAAVPDGTEIVPKNSAGVIFNPPLEKEVKIRVVRITKFRGQYNGLEADNWMQKVNSDNVNINKAFPAYTDIWPPYWAYIAEWGGSSEVINGIHCWRITVEILVNPLTWREEVPDRGVHARAEPGDPDGRGGTISLTDILDGAPQVRRLVDKFNKPITEPVLLDGNGGVLSATLPPVYITYQIYDEIPMAGIGL